ncbi:putative non-structural maintenance of chromosome element 4 [Rosellinia necatrix]|uniref:Non-structural maintenance of chromosomes element 4 n=1 Tax=Rosellinia necatrix TaxID=77044 RepID=A0A1W2TP63_ROSNE|nr:putative non-structural maintenance of chromosome element 4 [Rosellinia necatrix]
MSSPVASQDEESPASPMTASQQSTLVMRDRDRASESASKRKRTLTNGSGPSTSRRRPNEPEVVGDGDDSDQYDPDQPLEERRKVQRGYRDLLRGLQENTDELSNPKSLFLQDTLNRANQLSHHVKQTGEAIIDSKFLVAAADASYRRAARLANGNVAQGIDVDEFVTKCIRYMRLGAGIVEDDAPGLTATQQQRRRPARGNDDGSDEDEVGDEGDVMNWEHLGRFGCLPSIRRPAVPGFLLGPLSVEKKVRKVVKRSAPFRADNLRETRPEVLNAEDVQRAEKNDLTAICAKILRRLQEVQDEAQTKVEAAFEDHGDTEAQRLMNKYGLRDTGGIDLLKFVINPKSFGQTVENMFYVSFLIRDGAVQIEFDENGLPSLQPAAAQDSSALKRDAQRHQAVLSIDMQMWRDIIDAFDITEPIIEHRKEQSTQGPGARSWYS